LKTFESRWVNEIEGVYYDMEFDFLQSIVCQIWSRRQKRPLIAVWQKNTEENNLWKRRVTSFSYDGKYFTKTVAAADGTRKTENLSGQD
jgi:hypothetical protein